MNRLVDITKTSDIFPEYRNTPIGSLLEFHNQIRPLTPCTHAEMLIGMCMDHRKHLNIPDNFAYIIRTGGANLRYSEFKVSYTIAVGHIRHIVLIGHNNCGMVNLISNKKEFTQGLVEVAGWDPQWAEEHFMHFAPMFEIGNEIDFTISESKRLRLRYPKITVAPLFYNVDDNRLLLIRE